MYKYGERIDPPLAFLHNLHSGNNQEYKLKY